MIADCVGSAVVFRTASSQVHQLPHAMRLLDRPPGVPPWVVADRSYSSHHIREADAKPAIPVKCTGAPVCCRDWIYTNRNTVERLWPN